MAWLRRMRRMQLPFSFVRFEAIQAKCGTMEASNARGEALNSIVQINYSQHPVFDYEPSSSVCMYVRVLGSVWKLKADKMQMNTSLEIQNDSECCFVDSL